jgi:outer membrane protein assembly factor BamE (lipoprotein component of BamABCDE complex)
MKLPHLILILLLFLASCAPVIKPHGYQLEDILLQEPQIIGTSTKDDVLTSYGSPSIKIDDVSNTWLYLTSTKEKKVFTKDEFQEQIIFAFNFNDSNILISQEVYDKKNFLSIKIDGDQTYNYGSNYSILDQLYDAFTRGL